MALFFSVSPFAFVGKRDEGKELMMAEETIKVCLLHFRLKDLRKLNVCNRSHLAPSRCRLGHMISLVSTTEAVEVKRLSKRR